MKKEVSQVTRASLLLLDVTAADRLGWWPGFKQGIAESGQGKEEAIKSSTRGGSVNRAWPQPSPGAEHSVLRADASPRLPHEDRGAAGVRLLHTRPHLASCTQIPPGGPPVLQLGSWGAAALEPFW